MTGNRADAKTPRVLHVISHLEKGGAERQLRLFIQASTYEHFILVCKGNEGAIECSVEVFPSLMPTSIFRVTDRAIKRWRIDIVQLWLPDRITIPALFAALINKRKVISCDRCKPRSVDAGLGFLRDRLVYFNHFLADRVVANYPADIVGLPFYASGLIQRKLRVIPNGIEVGCRKVSPLDQVPRRLLFVGRLVSQKNISLLIRAFAQLLKEGAVTGLDLVGDGPEKDELIVLCQQLGVESQVHFFGDKRDWLVSFLPKDRLLVLPSKVEGMSNTLFEAMSQGFVVLCAESMELDTILSSMTKPCTFAQNSVESLISCVRSLLKEELASINERREALRNQVSKFSVEAMTSSYEDLYVELLDDI